MVAQKSPQWSAEPFVPTSRSLAALERHPSAALRAEEEAAAIRHRIVSDLERAARMT